MKFLWILLLIPISAFSQQTEFVWPVVSEKTGENILFKPHDYIQNELNFDRLIIGTKEGDILVAPVDGIISDFNYVYFVSLDDIISERPVKLNDTKNRLTFSKNNNNITEIDPQYVSAMVSITMQDRKKVYISGFKPVRPFKTGEQISKGDTLGYASFVYHKIPTPAIAISVSQNGKPSDPMSVFGLKSTFRKPTDVKPKEKLTSKEMEQDLSIIVEALKEGHPGLYDYIPKTQFDLSVRNAEKKSISPLSTKDFEKIIRSITGMVHDSHLSVTSENPDVCSKSVSRAPVYFGWLNDSLIITRTTPGYVNLTGRKISEIDGIPSDPLKTILSRYAGKTDGYVESYRNFNLLTLSQIYYLNEYDTAKTHKDLEIKFANGEVQHFNRSENNHLACQNILPSWSTYYFYPGKRYELKRLNDSTAMIVLGTFELNMTEMDKIRAFMKDISGAGVQNLVIDLRNNFGGYDQNISSLYSLIARKPFQTELFTKVNHNDTYHFFRYTLNYSPENHVLFPGYNRINGKEGYYKLNNTFELPDTAIHFNGRVYVMTNERSFSASAVFAGLVRKQGRGVTVGRETGAAYHHLNALKFAILLLPNSGLRMRIPLVKTVFDTVVDASRPLGRGVMPDYPVNFSLVELAWQDGDVILNYTMQLIANSEYIKPIPADFVPVELSRPDREFLLLVLGVALLVMVFLAIGTIRKRKVF